MTVEYKTFTENWDSKRQPSYLLESQENILLNDYTTKMLKNKKFYT